MTRYVVIILPVLAFSCSPGHQETEKNAKTDTLTVIDAAGRKVTVSKQANLILVICQTEIIRILDADDRVVAVNRWVKQLHCPENPVLCKLPVIGGFGPGDVNHEKILEIAGSTEGEDIIITYDKPWAEDIENKIGHVKDIKVLKFNFFLSDRFEDELRTFSRILAKEEQCEKYLAWRKEITDEIVVRLKHAVSRQTIKVYWDASAKGCFDTSNRKGGATKMINLSGGVNIAHDLPVSSVRVSSEWIMTENPEIILAHAANIRHMSGLDLGYDFNIADTMTLKKLKEEYIDIPGINQTDAVKNKKVYFICDNLMFGPMQPIGSLYLAKWFYPSVFQDIDPKDRIKEFYTSFIRLKPKGTFVYPEN